MNYEDKAHKDTENRFLALCNPLTLSNTHSLFILFNLQYSNIRFCCQFTIFLIRFKL